MTTKEVPVEQLREGMYVVELDRPWLGTPFPFQGFPISSDDEIETLKAYCKKVFVDPERTQTHDAKRRSPGHLRGSTSYTESAALGREVHLAEEIHQSCERALKQLLVKLRVEGDFDGEQLTGAVAAMTASIQRNPDAMLLLNALRQKDSYELGRAMDTSILMINFGRFLHFPTAQLEVLGLAGLLLDVGKTKLPDTAAQESGSAAANDDAMKAHVLLSVELIRNAPGLPKGVDEIVVLHHEQEDGNGYPYGLAGDAISTEGTIAALVDAFAELTCARRGEEGASPSNALNHLYKLRGTAFRPALVEQFIQCIGIYPVGSAVELNTGEVGLVISQNIVRRLQPRVLVILDAERKPAHPQKILDLVKEPKATPDEVYRIQRALPRNALPIDPDEFFL